MSILSRIVGGKSSIGACGRGGRAGTMGTGILLVILLLGCADSTSRAVNYFEDRAVYKAVCHYLDAEVNRDHRGVYESLAPSSPYCKNNSYEMYLSQAASAPAIASYKIIKISDIRMNGDRQRYPKIDKFARVEVELVLVLNEDGQTTEVNFAFPFVKEGGKWYKG